MTNGLPWSSEARTAQKTAHTQYRENIQSIAESLARHDSSERVLEKHVSAAIQVLDAYGHTKKPWYQRHEFEVGAGGLVFGWAFSVPDAVSWILAETSVYYLGVVTSLRISLVIIGLFLMIHGLMRGRGITAVR